MLFALAPLLAAVMIAISRCEDYRHDVYDVTIGSALGMSIAWFTYRRYYPALRHKRCDTPYPSKAELADIRGFSKAKNDEEARIQSAAEFELEDISSDDGGERLPLHNSRAP